MVAPARRASCERVTQQTPQHIHTQLRCPQTRANPRCQQVLFLSLFIPDQPEGMCPCCPAGPAAARCLADDEKTLFQ